MMVSSRIHMVYISIMGDVLFVADSGNHHVQKLTSTGKFLHMFGQQGTGLGQFYWPRAVIIDSNNKLIVSDHRIQMFKKNGCWLLTIDGEGSGNHSFQSQWGLALDPQGNIHVAAYIELVPEDTPVSRPIPEDTPVI